MGEASAMTGGTSMFSSFMAGANKASSYDALKKSTEWQGQAAKNAAYAKASHERRSDDARLMSDAQNMARQAGNTRRAAGNAVSARAASGVTAAGSGAAGTQQVLRAGAQHQADMAHSAAVQSQNSQARQIAYQREGDAALRAAQAQAGQYRAMAKMTRAGLWSSGVQALAGRVGGLRAGIKTDADGGQTFSWQEAMAGAMIGGNAGMQAGFASNPFLAQYAGNDWQKKYLWAMGVTDNYKSK